MLIDTAVPSICFDIVSDILLLIFVIFNVVHISVVLW